MRKSRRGRPDPGLGREFVQEGKRLIPLLAPAPADVVRISVPRSHPQAAELLELARLLANRQERESGLKIMRTPIPGAEERILALLSRMGVDTARIVADLKAGDAIREKKAGASDDPLLKVGLGLLHAAAGIIGSPDAAKPLADLVTREASPKT